jgi:hypothetical protein
VPPVGPDDPILDELLDAALRNWRRRPAAELEWNQQSRQFLLSYLCQLPVDTLWLWIKALWLGNATDEHLAMHVQSAIESLRPRDPTVPRGRRLIPAWHQVYDASLQFEYRHLKTSFKAFAQARQRHHAPMNRTRGMSPRSLDHRRGCLESPIGQRVNQAGLFSVFFDCKHLEPAQMAARLLHREMHQHLTTAEKGARAHAVKARDDTSREMWIARAMRAAAHRKALPAWRTLYRKLRAKKTPTRHSPRAPA